jgi:mono/diheme cytochrome c family protein
VKAVVDRVANVGGAMPAFAGRLSEEEIEDVSTYVVDAAGAP